MKDNLLEKITSAIFLFFSIFVVGVFTYHYSEFSLDDAAIYQRIIRNIAIHGRYTYNLTEPVNPGTSTIYPFLVSLFVFIFRDLSIQIISVYIDTIILVFATFLLMKSIWKLTSSYLATIGASLLAIILPLNDVLGMETGLLVLFLSMYLYFFENQIIRQTLTAFFPLVRLEGIVFWGAEGVYLFFNAKYSFQSILVIIKRLIPICIPFFLSIILNWYLFSEILPHSVMNKAEQGAWWPLYTDFVFRTFLDALHSPLKIATILLSIVGVVFAFYKRFLPVIFLFFGLVSWQFGLFVMRAPNYSWYATTLYFGLILGGIFGIGFIEIELRKRIHYKQTANLFLVGSIILFAITFWFIKPQNKRAPESRLFAEKNAANYISRLETANSHTKVASLEVGHLGNYLDETKYSIYDLCGLTSKNKGFFHQGFYEDFYCKDQPEYLVLNYFSKPNNVVPQVSRFSGEGYQLLKTSKNPNSLIAWPHLEGTLLDYRFTQAYEFLDYLETPNYPGGLAIYRFRSGFSCKAKQIQIQKITASKEHSKVTKAKYAGDGNPSTTWNAGDFTPQFLDFTFTKTESIKRIMFYLLQDKENEFGIKIHFIAEDDALTELPVLLKGNSGDIIELELNLERKVKRIRIETISGPSWVGWRDIQFF